MKEKIEQKNFDDLSLDMNIAIGVMPKKIQRDWMKRRVKYKLVRVKRITKCKCGKPLVAPFAGALCGDCLKQWDIQTWARLLARHHKGKATKCMKCGLVTNKGIQWHHWNYNKPLDVTSLCRKCHGLADGISKEQINVIIVNKRMNEL